MTEIQAVRYHDGDRHVAALVKVGTKMIHCACIDDTGVRVVSEPKEALKHCTPLLLKGKPYPVERIARAFKKFGRRRGMSAAAENIINEALST
jgi:hypothetical protein